MNNQLLSLRITRRVIAAAVFSKERLDYAEIHHVPVDSSKAQNAVRGFLARLVEMFEPNQATIETPSDSSYRSAVLTEKIVEDLRTFGIPLWMVKEQELLCAYGVPPLSTRAQLRLVAAGIWPFLDNPQYGPLILDASSLGLYVQAERLLHI